jgi:uncharacterized protein (TIGR03437 family)
VINVADGSVNDVNHPAARGSFISIYATGQGQVQNPPADGSPASAANSTTPVLPTVFVGVTGCTGGVDDSGCTKENFEHIPFSGLSLQYPGVWQINVQIPMIVPPGQQLLLVEMPGSQASYDPAQFKTAIYVK